MVSLSIWERTRRFILSLRYVTIWLSARDKLPTAWFVGPYSFVKIVRLSVIIFAILNFAAGRAELASGPMATNSVVFFWNGVEEALYAVTFITLGLGLSMWYLGVESFFLINLAIDFTIEVIYAPSYASPLTEIAVVFSAAYLVIVGLWLIIFDKGSKLNSLLMQS